MQALTLEGRGRVEQASCQCPESRCGAEKGGYSEAPRFASSWVGLGCTLAEPEDSS